MTEEQKTWWAKLTVSEKERISGIAYPECSEWWVNKPDDERNSIIESHKASFKKQK